MLPILRILPVGGVLLAILILVLALSPPDGSRSPMAAAIAPARGALVDRDRHPEVRQFLILAALKRADELNRLRELPDTPARSDNAQPKVAASPATEATPIRKRPASINETPGRQHSGRNWRALVDRIACDRAGGKRAGGQESLSPPNRSGNAPPRRTPDAPQSDGQRHATAHSAHICSRSRLGSRATVPSTGVR